VTKSRKAGLHELFDYELHYLLLWMQTKESKLCSTNSSVRFARLHFSFRPDEKPDGAFVLRGAGLLVNRFYT